MFAKMDIKLNTEALRYIAALQEISGAEVVKDCIVNENSIIYVVKQGQAGAAIGKKGTNVQRLSTILGKKPHIVELNDDPVKFASNLISTVKVKSIVLKGGQEGDSGPKKIIIEVDQKSRGAILGKGGKNIDMIKDLLKRHHGIDDVIVR